MLLVIHHLAVDGVSWRILVPDLESAYAAVARGRKPQLEPVAMPFRVWAQQLAEQAQSAAVLEELAAWQSTLCATSALLPSAELDPQRDTLGDAKHLSITLPVDVTSALLTKVPAAYHAGINDVLLTALTVAVAVWRRGRGTGGDGSIVIDLESHGREAAGGMDLSRTVGWFTSVFPVRLDVGAINTDEALAGGAGAGRALKQVKEQLRAVPGHGLGYGLLRYVNDATAGQLAGYAERPIGFNYLGRFTTGGEGVGDWSIARETGSVGVFDAAMPMAHLLDVNAVTADGATGPALSAHWSWAGSQLSEDEVGSLCEAWRLALEGLVRHVEQPGAGGHTPSDFPLVKLSQAQIEELEKLCPEVEEILPLSPLQEGLVFHALYEDVGVDVYTVQFAAELAGGLDAERMRRAAEALLRRHSNLRVSVHHEGLAQPVQMIPRGVCLPWEEAELCGQTKEEWLAADRLKRFVFTDGPLLRFSLVSLDNGHQMLVFTYHHVLLDGWSTPIVISELMALYGSDGNEDALPRVRPYAEYLRWLAGQDRERALGAWRKYLADAEPTLVAGPAVQSAAVLPHKWEQTLSEELTTGLQALAREHGLTLNTVVQGLWAVLLGRLTGRDDVVFGVTVAGRPAEIAGIEQMVGLFINTVPVRVRLRPEQSLVDLLAEVQRSQSELLSYQHVGLAEI